MNKLALAATAAVLALFASAAPSHSRESEATILQRAIAAKTAAGRAAQANGRITIPRATTSGTVVTFDAPGAGTGQGQGTSPMSISAVGPIAGFYTDIAYAYHGFVRDTQGRITTFDAPGAGAGQGQGTQPMSISANGVIAGFYTDANNVSHGFVRNAQGQIATFGAPPSHGAAGQSISAVAINAAGSTAGYFTDAIGAQHGFVRASDGKLIRFNVPGAAVAFQFNGTAPSDINRAGAVVGTYESARDLESHGFLRSASGGFKDLNPPPVGYIPASGPYGFGNIAIYLHLNAFRWIAGTYFQYIPGNPFRGDYRGFVRYPGGAFVGFDAANYGPCCIWTIPSAINDSGTVAGMINDGFSIFRGFVRTTDASVTTFDAPGAGTGFDQGTVPLGINAAGGVTGLYIDANNVNHGFLLTP